MSRRVQELLQRVMRLRASMRRARRNRAVVKVVILVWFGPRV